MESSSVEVPGIAVFALAKTRFVLGKALRDMEEGSHT